MAWDNGYGDGRDEDNRGPCGIIYGQWVTRDPNYVKKKEPPKEPEPPKAPTNDWIKIKVVDDHTGRVEPGVLLDLQGPSGFIEYGHETRRSGLVESLGLQSGECEVSCDIKDLTLKNTTYMTQSSTTVGGNSGLSLRRAASGVPTQLVITQRCVMPHLRKGQPWKSIIALYIWTLVVGPTTQTARASIAVILRWRVGQMYIFASSIMASSLHAVGWKA